MPENKPATAPSCASQPALDLRHARKQTGISLDEIAARTKISSRFLQAIEAEEFEKLPGGIFTTSYLRQYAAAIGYDATALLEYYNLKMNPQAAGHAEQQSKKGRRNVLDRWLRMPAQASR